MDTKDLLCKTLQRSIDVITLYAVPAITFIILVRTSWVITIIAAIASIFVYSFLWNIAQEIPEEDWYSQTAEYTAVSVVMVLYVLDISAITILAIIFDAPKMVMVLIGVMFAAMLFLGSVVGTRLQATRHMLFPGAYINYRRRVKQ